jgi:hypothetical protein
MARKKSAHGYELELRKMIKERTGADCEVWLYPQVRATAGNMVVLDKVQEEVLGLGSLTKSVTGSTGQQKIVVDPLIPYYDKMQRTLMLQFEALGLNYKTMPSKVNEPTKKGGGDHDKLGQVLEDISNV